MSSEQKKYILKLKLEKFYIIITQIIILSVGFGLWEYLSYHGYINAFLYSSPSRIINTIIELYKSNNLFCHIFQTLYEIIISFSLGSVLGIIFAIILYKYKIIAKIIEPFLILLNSMPKVALGPLIIIIFGANIKSIIIMALLINLIITILTIYNGFLAIDINKNNLLKSFNATNWQNLLYLIIPSSISTILSSMKINVSMTLIGVIMGEFLVSKKGIGYLIIYGTQVFNLDLVMTGIFIIIFISYFLYKIVSIIEKKQNKN